MYETNKKTDILEETTDVMESEHSASRGEPSTPEETLSAAGECLPALCEKAGGDVPTATSPPAVLDEDYAKTIVLQLAGTVPRSQRDSASFPAALDDAIATYKLMNPADPLDSALCRLIVALTNAGMDSLGRAAASAGLSQTQERDLKLGMKAAVTTADLIKVLDSRRVSGRQHLNVGPVNVQSGGQAIIGNISNTKSEPAPPASAGGGGDDDDAD